MDCCGHALTRRNWMWGTILTSVGAVIGGGLEPRGSTAAAQTAAESAAFSRRTWEAAIHAAAGQPPNTASPIASLWRLG
jgi:hypothetical protein